MKNIFFKIGVFLILLLPILNYPPLFSPPDFGKSTVFRIIFSVLLILFACYSFFHKETDLFKRTVSSIKKGGALFYSPLILLGILIIATFFSTDVNFSIFGDPNRGGGMLTFSMLVLFSYILIFSLDKDDWKFVWNTSFFAGVVVCFFAIIQWLGVFERIPTTTRPFSTTGNATILSIYILLLFFPLLAFFIKEKKKILKWTYLSILSLFAFIILITFTRAVFIGLFLGLLYFFLFYPKKGKVLLIMRLATVVMISLSVFSVYYINTYEKPKLVEENKILNMLSNRLSVERALGDPRIGGFMIAWESVKEKPLLGYGPENFVIAFSQHYHPQMPNIEKDFPWWDRTHNLLLEMAVWGGVLAALTMFLLFVFLFLSLGKNKTREKHTLQAGVIAFFAASMFTIDSFIIYLVFFLLFSYTVFLSSKEESVIVNLEKRKIFLKYKTVFLVVSIIFLVPFLYSYSILPLLANRDINKAMAYRDAKICEKALELANEATKYDTVIDSYLYRRKTAITESCLEDNKETAFIVFELIKRVEEERPLHVQNLVDKVSYIVKVLPHLSNEERVAVIEDAQDTLELLKEITPHRYNTYLNESKINMLIGRYEEMYESSNQCLQLKEDKECYFLRAFAKAALDKEGVEEDLLSAKREGLDTKTENNLNLLTVAYANAENYERIIPIFQDLIEIDPTNAQYHLSLAVNFSEIGNYAKAREYALNAISLRPSEAERIYSFINSLPQ